MIQTFHPKQLDALSLLGSGISNILLPGGSRSGKTYAIISKIVALCYLYPGLRCLIGRQHNNHIKDSIWRETLPAVMKFYSKATYTLNGSDLIVEFINGSEIALVGFDNEDRVEKIFGREFGVIFLNEASQISYDIVIKVRTRLAQVVTGFKNRMYFDLNPPSPLHWAHKLFIEHVDPKTNVPIDNPNDYAWLGMNPIDNPLLSQDYLKSLAALPERDKKRFLLGEWVKVEGAIYSKFDLETCKITLDELPKMDYFVVGSDTSGTNYAAILLGFAGSKVFLLDEKTAYRESIANFDASIRHDWQQYNYTHYGDPSAAQLLDQMWNCFPGDNAVEPGINCVREYIESGNFFILYKDGRCNCPQFIAEIESYAYDPKGRIIKENDHLLDSVRYGLFSHSKFGASIVVEVTR